MKRLTKVEMFQRIATRLTSQDEIDFINHEIELVKAKNASPKKPTATQLENEQFKLDIVNFLTSRKGTAFTIAQLMECVTSLTELSNQRISALLKQLVDANKVVKTYEKRKAYFSVD